MLCLYRLSDQAQTSAHKPKIPEATKLACLRNFISEFGTTSLYVLADRVQPTTYQSLLTYLPKERIVQLNYGSGGITFLHAALMVKDSSVSDDTMIYFVEDDYIHTDGSLQKILQGLSLSGVDYVTGYDHPDKYMQPIQSSLESKLYMTATCHWRTTPSTTMTFATTARTVRADYSLYETYCKTGYPYDNEMFHALRATRGRTLISAIPGFCTHAEIAWLSPHVHWQDVIKNYTEA